MLCASSYIHVRCCWCSFAFAWILTVVSPLCLTLCYLSNIVWVHIIFSIIENYCWLVFLPPSPPFQQHLLLFKPHCPSLVPFVSCIIPIFHFCHLNAPLSHPSISSKVHSFAFKRMPTGWSSQARRTCPAGGLACSDWSWFLSTVLCSWPSTPSSHWPMFALRSSWIKTISLGIVRMNYFPNNVFL